jgi:transposase
VSHGQAAAVAFDAAARAVLLAEGRTGRGASASEVARIVGCHRSQYSDALDGRASLDLVARWIDAWRAAGWPELELRIRAQRVKVVRAHVRRTLARV